MVAHGCGIPCRGIFEGNSLVVRGQGCGSPSGCTCVVSITKSPYGKPLKSASCSVAFTSGSHAATKLGSNNNATTISSDKPDCDTIGPGVFDRVVLCDPGLTATVTCVSANKDGSTGSKSVTVAGGTSKNFVCSGNVVSSSTGSWTKGTGAYGSASGSIRSGKSLSARPRVQDDQLQPQTVITGTEAIVIAGEAGVSVDRSGHPRVTVTQGQTTVTSFCDGGTGVFNAPAATDILNNSAALNFEAGNYSVTYDPNAGTCQLTDISGIWRGMYTNSTPDGETQGDPLTISITGNTGTITTSDDSLSINTLSFEGETLAITATSSTSGGTLTISGTLTKGVMTFSAQADGLGPSGDDYTGGEGSAERVTIYQNALPNAAVNMLYSAQLYDNTPTDMPVSWSIVSGSLPAGMSLDPVAGVISGTAVSTGPASFTVQIVDANGDTFQQPLSLTVANLTLAANILPFAYAGQLYQYQLQVAGGQAPYTFTNNSPLASFGFSIPGLPQISSSGMITLDQTSLFSESSAFVSFSVQDSQGLTQSFVVGIPVASVTLTGSEILPDASVGSAYSYTFPTLGAAGSVTWTPLDDMSAIGLYFDPTSGAISGTPVVSDSFSFEITVTDQYGSDSRIFVLNVDPSVASASLREPRGALANARSRR